jgi:hypothetical protein
MKKRLFPLTLALAVIAGGQLKLADAHAAESKDGQRITDADLIGKWAGDLEVRAEKTPQRDKKEFELVFSKEAAMWKAISRFNVNGNDSSNTRDVTVTGNRVSFRCNIGDSEWVFKGRLAEGKLKGDIEILENQESVAKGTWSAIRAKK